MLRVGSVDAMLAVARDEARRSYEEGGIPIGAARFDADCIELMGRWILANDALWNEDIGELPPE